MSWFFAYPTKIRNLNCTGKIKTLNFIYSPPPSCGIALRHGKLPFLHTANTTREGMLFSETESSSSQAYRSSEGSEATSNSIRFPVGARLNLNIVYPVQLVVGAEYIFNIKIPVNDSSSTKVYSDPEKFFFKPTGYKRNGLNIYAGLRFNF